MGDSVKYSCERILCFCCYVCRCIEVKYHLEMNLWPGVSELGHFERKGESLPSPLHQLSSRELGHRICYWSEKNIDQVRDVVFIATHSDQPVFSSTRNFCMSTEVKNHCSRLTVVSVILMPHVLQ